MITVDTNPGEDALFGALCDGSDAATTTRRRLDVGDVLIERPPRREEEDNDDDSAHCCRALTLERKTWPDLASSLHDGRFHEQKARALLDDDDDASHHHRRHAYVIEGALPPWHGRTAALYAALCKTVLRDGVTVFHTRNPSDTAQLCLYLAKQMRTDGLAPGGGGHTRVLAGGTLKRRKRDNLDGTPQALLRAMLATIPGMSPAKADALLAADYADAPALARASEAQLADVRVGGGRRLGPKLAATIKSVFAS